MKLYFSYNQPNYIVAEHSTFKFHNIFIQKEHLTALLGKWDKWDKSSTGKILVIDNNGLDQLLVWPDLPNTSPWMTCFIVLRYRKEFLYLLQGTCYICVTR